MALILTTPISAGGTSTSISLQDISVLPNSTIIVDNVSILNTPTAKWFVTIKNIVTNESISQEIFANISNLVVTHMRYGICGTLLPHVITVTSDVTDLFLQLEITNITNDNYVVDVFRLF